MSVTIPIFKLCICWAEEPDGPQKQVVIPPGGKPEADLKRLFVDEISKENVGRLKSQEQVMQSVSNGIDRALVQFKKSAFGL